MYSQYYTIQFFKLRFGIFTLDWNLANDILANAFVVMYSFCILAVYLADIWVRIYILWRIDLNLLRVFPSTILILHPINVILNIVQMKGGDYTGCNDNGWL